MIIKLNLIGEYKFLLTRLMRGAAYIGFHTEGVYEFLLTRLMRGAAEPVQDGFAAIDISTHAPHARRGVVLTVAQKSPPDFYSRASCEARLALSVRGKLERQISTHAPHARRGSIQKSRKWQ